MIKHALFIYLFIYLRGVIIFIYLYNTIHMYSGITSGRVLDGELLYTKILEVNLLPICPVDWREISMKQSVGKC